MKLVFGVVDQAAERTVLIVIVGMAYLALSDEGAGLFFGAFIMNVVENNLRGDDGPQHFIFRYGARCV